MDFFVCCSKPKHGNTYQKGGRTMCDQSEPTTWIKLAALPRTSLSQTSTWMHLRIPGKLLCGTAPAPSSASSTHELLQCYMMLHCLLWQLIGNMLMQLPSKQSNILQQHRLSQVQKITSFPLYMTVRKTLSLAANIVVAMSGTCVQVWWNTCCKRPCYMYQRRSTHMISDRSVYCQGAFETRTGMCFPPGTQDVSAWNPGTSLAPMVN